MATICITGGSGLVGKALAKSLLDRGYKVIILTRSPENKAVHMPGISYAGWNVAEQTINKDAITGADYIIHLAGAGVAEKRWTKKRKQEITESRIKSGELLVNALKENSNNVKAVISASAIGWYGHDPKPNLPPGRNKLSSQSEEGNGIRKFEEHDPPANDFLGQTCRQWEESIDQVIELGIRLVKLRIGIVLSNDGGALKEFKKPLQFGVAAILGSGRQIISWIHIEDLVNMFIAAIENTAMTGVYNAVAPNPVSNKELVLALARTKRKFFIPIPVPAFILKMILGEMSMEVLKSATISSNKITGAGFVFKYPSIEMALKNLN